MKSKTLVIRVTSKERDRLEEEAKAVNKNFSEYIRLKIFNKEDNDYGQISMQISSLQNIQKQQLSLYQQELLVLVLVP